MLSIDNGQFVAYILCIGGWVSLIAMMITDNKKKNTDHGIKYCIIYIIIYNTSLVEVSSRCTLFSPESDGRVGERI